MIVAGYVTPPAVVATAALVMPRSMGDLGGAAVFAFALMAAAVLSAVWLLAGTLTGADAVRLARRHGLRVRWYDYATLVAGALPLVVTAAALLAP